jgi:hypothetical protein
LIIFLTVSIKAVLSFSGKVEFSLIVVVPDLGSRDRDVVLVRRTICTGKPRGVRNLEWGGNGEGMRRGRSVYEQPGTKVDRIVSRQRRVSK